MVSLAVASAVRAELPNVPNLSGTTVIEANDYNAATAGETPFLLLLFPPSVTTRRNLGTPAQFEEVGVFSLRYHIPSGSPIDQGRLVIDTLQDYFRGVDGTGRHFPAGSPEPVFTRGEFSGYESDEPAGNWYELHLVVPFRRIFTKGP